MTARSRHRGHRIKWAGHKWVFTDWSDPTMFKYGKERPCTRCDNLSDGPDRCLGRLPYVRQACCGHGCPEDAYFVFDNGVEVRGADAVKLRECWTHNCVTPRLVIEVFLQTLNVKVTYRLCQLHTAGAISTGALAWVGGAICRKSVDIAPICGILEVDRGATTKSLEPRGTHELEGDHEHSTPSGRP